MTDALRDKLLALLRLSREGTGGEATNAEAVLERLLAQHGLTLADIDDDAITKVRVSIKYNDPNDKFLFSQVCSMVLDESRPPIRRFNGTRTIFLDVTPAQRAEIIVRYEILREAFKEEIETLFTAFIIKHRVWSASAKSTGGEMDEKTRRAMAMARSLKDVELTKRLTNGDLND